MLRVAGIHYNDALNARLLLTATGTHALLCRYYGNCACDRELLPEVDYGKARTVAPVKFSKIV